ncbi:MAG TPA: class I SAM-dependent RNA methyltransferase [Gemmatimonadaceae bacterium]|nr:class I SAM-dependent RNA methyltransferase [Gemmatimonadaceae bacterium]
MPKSPSRNSPTRFELFAVTAPGLESITAGELKTLGMKGRQQPGGVEFAGDAGQIYQSNLWLRTASRVLLRLGQFHASTFYELERRAKKLDWAAFLPATGLVEVRVTCRKSRLYHSDAVAERILGAIARVAPSGLKIVSARNEDVESEDSDAQGTGKAVPDGDATPSSQSFVVRIVDDQCEISADTSGELLHRRGYRLETAKAPLRETLAAAMVLASGWKNNEPLIDPMCGSGTIPIEAALIARRMAPGLNRRFQFMNWAWFDGRLWNEIVEKAKDSIIAPALGIHGSDRVPGAIESAKRNAERAGVTSDVQFSTESVSGAFAGLEDVADGEGWIITNPPYGVGVGESADLRNLYATLGNSVKAKARWRIGVLAAEDALAGQMRLPMGSRFESRNGGIPVRFLVSERIEHGTASAVR